MLPLQFNSGSLILITTVSPVQLTSWRCLVRIQFNTTRTLPTFTTGLLPVVQPFAGRSAAVAAPQRARGGFAGFAQLFAARTWGSGCRHTRAVPNGFLPLRTGLLPYLVPTRFPRAVMQRDLTRCPAPVCGQPQILRLLPTRTAVPCHCQQFYRAPLPRALFCTGAAWTV